MNARDAILDLKERMGRSIIGQEQVVERLLLTLLCNGNLLIEGLPGLAKTRAVKSLAKNLETDFSRIQFTPDLLPSDITGSEMFLGEDAKERFEFQPGPIFANIVLADEVNRAPAKVQAALLEAMEERQITVATTTHKLPPLFMVMATQNPIEQEGTYPLPEAQMDRFLMHVFITYPDDDSERDVMRLVRGEEAKSQRPTANEKAPSREQPIAQSAVLMRVQRSPRQKSLSPWRITSSPSSQRRAGRRNSMKIWPNTYRLVSAREARSRWTRLRAHTPGCVPGSRLRRMIFVRSLTTVCDIVLSSVTRHRLMD